MIKRRFSYQAPSSIDEAIGALAEAGSDAEIVGGGTWVVPEMTHGDRNPGVVIDLRSAGLAGVSESNGGLSVGAMTTYAELADSKLVQERAGGLAAMAAGITGGAQVRYQGTIGGSACYATPSSDAPGALVGLGATLQLRSGSGTREVDAADFFKGAREGDLQAGEVLEAIAIPAPPENARFGHYKLKLVESSWPIATATCIIGVDGSGSVSSARLAVGGVNTTPYLVDVSGLVGSALDDEAAASVVETTRAGATDPYSDVLASGEYRQQVSGVVAKRALLAAAG